MNALTKTLMTTLAAAGLALSAPAFASTTVSADALCGGGKDVKKPTDDDGKKTKNPASVELCGGGKDVKKPTDDDGKKTKNPASVELCGGGKDVKKPTDDDGKKKTKNPA